MTSHDALAERAQHWLDLCANLGKTFMVEEAETLITGLLAALRAGSGETYQENADRALVDALADDYRAGSGDSEPTCDACGKPMTGYDADGQWCDEHGKAPVPAVSPYDETLRECSSPGNCPQAGCPLCDPQGALAAARPDTTKEPA